MLDKKQIRVIFFISVQFSSVTQTCPTLCDAMDCSTPSLPVHHQLLSLLKLMSTELVLPSNHLILCRPLLLPPSIFPSIKVFSNDSVLYIRWPKCWSFSFSISPSSEYSGLISFRMDWLDLLAVQGTLKSLLHHHSSKALFLRCSAFFIVQLSHPYMTTGETIALTRWTFVGKVISLIFNMLSRLVIAFLPRSKCLLISWLQSPSAVILESKKLSLSLFPLFPHLFAMKWWLKFKLSHKAAETTCSINNAFGPGTANGHTVQWWFKKSCKGADNLEDEEHSDCPLEVNSDQLRG